LLLVPSRCFIAASLPSQHIPPLETLSLIPAATADFNLNSWGTGLQLIMYAKTCVALALLGIAAGEANPRPTPAPTARAEESQVTAITDCHLHETDL
jgi:hypothetical protein